MLGESLHITFEYLTQEANAASFTSKKEAMEAETSTLKQNLIHSMGEATTLKEKVKALSDDLRTKRQLTLEKDEQLLDAKEKLKTIVARSVEAFQMTDKYNTVLFSWYFKGFELLRRYLVKHPSGVDLGKLDQVPRVPLLMTPSRVPQLMTLTLVTTSLLMPEPSP